MIAAYLVCSLAPIWMSKSLLNFEGLYSPVTVCGMTKGSKSWGHGVTPTVTEGRSRFVTGSTFMAGIGGKTAGARNRPFDHFRSATEKNAWCRFVRLRSSRRDTIRHHCIAVLPHNCLQWRLKHPQPCQVLEAVHLFQTLPAPILRRNPVRDSSPSSRARESRSATLKRSRSAMATALERLMSKPRIVRRLSLLFGKRRCASRAVLQDAYRSPPVRARA
jgi:hypothetical protein